MKWNTERYGLVPVLDRMGLIFSNLEKCIKVVKLWIFQIFLLC